MGLERIAAPALEPVSLEEARDHLRLTQGAEDGTVDALITAARELAETLSGGRQFITARWRWTSTAFPGGYWNTYGWNCREMIELPKPPLQSVESVNYVDLEGDLQTLDASAYQVVTNELRG